MHTHSLTHTSEKKNYTQRTKKKTDELHQKYSAFFEAKRVYIFTSLFSPFPTRLYMHLL